MARTAALLPCGPDELLDLDMSMFNELAKQVDERERSWRRRDEMAAAQIEMTHLVYRAIIATNSSKKVNIPDFRYPRPGDDKELEVEVVSHHDMYRRSMTGSI